MGSTAFMVAAGKVAIFKLSIQVTVRMSEKYYLPTGQSILDGSKCMTTYETWRHNAWNAERFMENHELNDSVCPVCERNESDYDDINEDGIQLVDYGAFIILFNPKDSLGTEQLPADMVIHCPLDTEYQFKYQDCIVSARLPDSQESVVDSVTCPICLNVINYPSYVYINCPLYCSGCLKKAIELNNHRLKPVGSYYGLKVRIRVKDALKVNRGILTIGQS